MPDPKVASVIDLSQPLANQKPVTVTAPLAKPVVFTADQMKDHNFSAKQLTAMSTQIAQVTQAHRAHPERAPITFQNVICGDSQTKTTLHHNFGRRADFIVVMWKGAGTTAGASLVCDEDDAADVVTDNNKISLRSAVAGKANIRVYPRG